MNPMFFKALRESRVPFDLNGQTRASRPSSPETEVAETINILMIGGHPRQIQDISSIARSLSGGGSVNAVNSLAAAQDQILRGKNIDWVIAAIRPFDSVFINSLGRLHDRTTQRSDAKWMALWPGLRPPDNELINWQIHLSYPASVGQIRRALVGEPADY